MPTTLTPQQVTPPETAARPTDVPQTGLRHWTREEYYRMGDMDIFDGGRVELLDGDIWQVHASDLYRWTGEQYHLLIEAGFFDDGRVELLGGMIWDMAGQLSLHSTGVRLVQLALEEAFPGAFEVRIQMPVTLPDGMEPEPDIAVAPGTPRDYEDHHPRPDELLLVVEVSDSSLVKDRGPKLVSYAQALIPEYWLLNLADRQLEVYRQPTPGGIYAHFRVYRSGDSVAPLSAPNQPVAVADLLPTEPKQNL